MKSTNDIEKKPPAIPKKIHFIWLGGPLPEKYFSTIASLAGPAINSRFELNLWVDDQNNYYKSSIKLDREIPNIRIRHVNELRKTMEKDPFYQKDDRLKYYESYLAREQIGLKNLGAASDLLRYEILRQEGGYYFDTDTTFQELTPETKLKSQHPPYGIFLVGMARGDWNNFRGFVNNGNDIIGAIPHCVILNKTIEYVINTYKEYDTTIADEYYLKPTTKEAFLPAATKESERSVMDKKRMYYPTKLFNRRCPRTTFTIDLTGPGALWTCAEDHIKKLAKNNNVETYRDVIFPGISILQTPVDVAGTIPITNSDQTWVKNQEKQPSSYDENALPNSKKRK